jgi:GT2 family glycosyltransferase/lipopolysaccharide/colanic/teichoic acid biosynthesis glycosyltransferase
MDIFPSVKSNQSTSKPTDISIVIVNYNVKEYLVNLLNSIKNSKGNLKTEIFVVDNHSTDGSVEYLSPRFTDVHFIANQQNFGFGKANNQAIQLASGRYTLLLNPDTLISEDTLRVMFDHMEANQNTGAAGCKLLNPDGSFAPESRRSVPTPFSALWKVLGLTKLFPKNKRFADYYLGWMDENQSGPVPVLSGAFMFYRSSVLKELDGFDERFFMYGEDIDLSFRTTQAGYQIDYIPTTSIIHYKGESTKKENLDYVIVFNKAMYQFFEKHYSYAYTFIFKFFVVLGIIFRAGTSYIGSLFRRFTQPIIDLFILNLLVSIFFMIRYNIDPNEFLEQYSTSYLMVNAFLTLFFIGFGRYYELYGLNKFSVMSIIKAVTLSFMGVVVITFFLREFAFSRWILLFGAFTSSVILGFYRFWLKNYSKKRFSQTGTIKPVRVLIVGVGNRTLDLISLIRSKIDWNYEIVGVIVQNEIDWVDRLENIPVIGRTEHVPDLVRFHSIDQLIFLGNTVSNDEILNIMTQIRKEDVFFKIVPESMDFIIGKSNVEYFDDIPLVDVRLAYSVPWNQFLKRNLDFWMSLFVLIIGLPVMLPLLIFKILKYGFPQRIEFYLDGHHKSSLKLWLPYEKSIWVNRYLQMFYVLMGRISLVGSPIIQDRKDVPLYYKPGITGLRQINETRLYRDSEKEKFELFYVQNYSIWMDLDILTKTLFKDTHSPDYVSKGDSL